MKRMDRWLDGWLGYLLSVVGILLMCCCCVALAITLFWPALWAFLP